MRKVITQNDLMMFITENNLLDAYIKEPLTYIIFNFKNNYNSTRIGLISFMNEEPTDCNYEYTGSKTRIDNSGDHITEFYFEKQ